MTEESKPLPIELVKRGDPESTIWYMACGMCGHLYSPRIYATTLERGIEEARRAAADCVMCRAVDKDPKAEERERESYRARRIEKATEVTDLDHCFSDDGECFYSSTSDAAEAGETGVFGAVYRPYQMDLSDMLQAVIEGHHDDASTDELNGVDDLAKAVDEFNNNQTMGSYEMDGNNWQRIQQPQTFGMIKPDATARGIEQEMMDYITSKGFRIVETRRQVLDRAEAEWLYQEHRGKDHFDGLVDYTISGEVVMMLIEGDEDNVPAAFRTLMGATDHTKADPGTLRSRYAVGYRENSIHGSDSPRAAIDEIIHFMS